MLERTVCLTEDNVVHLCGVVGTRMDELCVSVVNECGTQLRTSAACKLTLVDGVSTSVYLLAYLKH